MKKILEFILSQNFMLGYITGVTIGFLIMVFILNFGK